MNTLTVIARFAALHDKLEVLYYAHLQAKRKHAWNELSHALVTLQDEIVAHLERGE